MTQVHHCKDNPIALQDQIRVIWGLSALLDPSSHPRSTDMWVQTSPAASAEQLENRGPKEGGLALAGVLSG